jgi:hypothetical protein
MVGEPELLREMELVAQLLPEALALLLTERVAVAEREPLGQPEEEALPGWGERLACRPEAELLRLPEAVLHTV